MDETLQKYLYDVIGAVTETLSYFDGRPKHLYLLDLRHPFRIAMGL